MGWGAWVSGRVGGWITKTAFASTQGLYFWCRICNKTQAERVSYESGFRFQDRNGVWQNNEPKDIAGLALRAWCAEMGVQYS